MKLKADFKFIPTPTLITEKKHSAVLEPTCRQEDNKFKKIDLDFLKFYLLY